MLDFFNWTMTYRPDSDIPVPLGRIIRKMSDSDMHDYARKVKPYDSLRDTERFNSSEHLLLLSQNSSEVALWKMWSKRPRQVAWVVSHCPTHSRREDYVQELKQHIQVDVFGKCGQPCPNQRGKIKVFHIRRLNLAVI